MKCKNYLVRAYENNQTIIEVDAEQFCNGEGERTALKKMVAAGLVNNIESVDDIVHIENVTGQDLATAAAKTLLKVEENVRSAIATYKNSTIN